jgi:hypothetical protein
MVGIYKMKIKYSFTSYDPRGRTMVLKEGDTVPIGWFTKDWDSEVLIEVTEAAVVVGETTDRTNPCSGAREIFRTLSVATPAQIVAAIAAKAVDQAAVARNAEEYAVWVAANKAREAARKSAKKEIAITVAPTDTSNWNSLDWQAQVERDNDRSW